MAVVVDTDVISFQFKGDSRAALYDAHLAGEILVVSFMTVAELDYWAVQNNWGQHRRDRLGQHLSRFVLHDSDRALCWEWASVRDGARRRGQPIGIADAWIAATARVLNIPLVTHNPADYTGIVGLTVLSAATP
jgi:tRNA(fMet)-specific endonuclease VapC